MTKKELIADIHDKMYKYFDDYFDSNLYDEECLLKWYETLSNNKIEESSIDDSNECSRIVVNAYLIEIGQK